MCLAERVRFYRERKGLSRRKLAELIGKSQAYVGMLERGDISQPTAGVIYRLAEVLEAPAEELLEAAATQPPPCEWDAEAEAAIEAEAEQRWAEQSRYGDFTAEQKARVMEIYRAGIRARNARLARERQIAEQRAPYSAAG